MDNFNWLFANHPELKTSPQGASPLQQPQQTPVASAFNNRMSHQQQQQQKPSQTAAAAAPPSKINIPTLAIPPRKEESGGSKNTSSMLAQQPSFMGNSYDSIPDVEQSAKESPSKEKQQQRRGGGDDDAPPPAAPLTGRMPAAGAASTSKPEEDRNNSGAKVKTSVSAGFFSKSYVASSSSASASLPQQSSSDKNNKQAPAATTSAVPESSSSAALQQQRSRAVMFKEQSNVSFGAQQQQQQPLSARTQKSDYGHQSEQINDAARKALASLRFQQTGVLDYAVDLNASFAGPKVSASAQSQAALGVTAPAAAASSQSAILPAVAQKFTPGSAPALRALRSVVSVGFTGACSGTLVNIDGRAWVITSTEAVFDPAKNEYFKLGDMAIRSPVIPKHFVPDGLFVCGSSSDAHQHSVALLSFGQEYSMMLLSLCVKLSAKICALHSCLLGYQVEVPVSRRVFDDEHIYGHSSVSAVSVNIVQMRSEFTWRALPDAAASCNTVAGAALFDEVGDCVAVMVDMGAMLTATAYQQRWDSHRGVLSSATDREFLIRDFQVQKLKNRAFSANTSAGADGGAKKIFGQHGHGGGDNFAPEFVGKNVDWGNETTLATLECAAAFDELISSASRESLNRLTKGPAAASAAAARDRLRQQQQQQHHADPHRVNQQKTATMMMTQNAQQSLQDLQNFTPILQPSSAAMSLATVLPRMMRMGSSSSSLVFVHGREAASRMTEVKAGSLKVAHIPSHGDSSGIGGGGDDMMQ